MKSAQILKAAATVSLLLVPGPRLQAQTPTGLSALTGEWTLNREKSDNPQDKIAAAMKGPTESTDKLTVTTRQPAGTPVRMPPRPLGAPSNQNDDRGIYRSATREVVFGGESLHIGTTEDAVVIQYPGGSALSLKANGKKENIQRFGAAEAMTKAEWKKDKLTIETDANDGLTTKEEYEVSEKNGVKQLQVNAQMRLTNGEIVRVKRVYDPKPTGS